MPNVTVEIVSDKRHPYSGSDFRKVVDQVLSVLPDSRDWRVILRFVGDRAMQALNKRHLAKAYPTDVLSFPIFSFREGRPPALPPGPLLLGEVVVNLDEAGRRSTASGHSLILEVQSLIAHGLAHLIGFHHE